MINADEIRQRIHDYIVTNFLFGTADVDNSESLLDSGVVDSMGVLELVLFLEEELGVVVADEEVRPESFDTVDALTAFVISRLEAPAAEPPLESGVEQ
jgi:acyl carrier protein